MRPDEFLKRSEVLIERRFDAPPPRLYRAWTTPDEMAAWMWASLGRETWAECDLRVGGAYRVYTRLPGGRDQGDGWSGMCGQFVEIVPDERLVYTVHWDADVGYNRGDRLALDEVAAVTFTPDSTGTLVVYRHTGIPDDGRSAPTHRAGIEESFTMLAAQISAGERTDR